MESAAAPRIGLVEHDAEQRVHGTLWSMRVDRSSRRQRVISSGARQHPVVVPQPDG
jgi:hypothetical protein